MAPKMKESIQRKSQFVENNLCDEKTQVVKMEKGVDNTLIKKSF